MNRIESLTVHHSASSRDLTTFEDIERWHTKRKKRPFRAIGYHFVITGDAELHVGRPLPQQGAHAPPNNGRAGVVLTGDNTILEERWNKDQVAKLQRLWGALRLIWPGIDVEGHRDVNRTACPGVDVRAMLLGPAYALGGHDDAS